MDKRSCFLDSPPDKEANPDILTNLPMSWLVALHQGLLRIKAQRKASFLWVVDSILEISLS